MVPLLERSELVAHVIAVVSVVVAGTVLDDHDLEFLAIECKIRVNSQSDRLA